MSFFFFFNHTTGRQEISPEFIGRTVAKAEAPVLWPPDSKNWLIGQDPDAGKDWRWEQKGMTEDEMVGWPHRLNGHEFEQALGDGEAQGSLAAKSWTRLSNWTTTGRQKCDCMWWLLWRAKERWCWAALPADQGGHIKEVIREGTVNAKIRYGHSAMCIWILISVWPWTGDLHLWASIIPSINGANNGNIQG